MKTKEALKIVSSRGGIPRENDWELLEAAERLAKHTSPSPSAGLRMVNSKQMKDMVAGDTIISAAGNRKPSGCLQGTSVISTLCTRHKMKVVQHVIILIDPKTYQSSPAILVTCITPSTQKTK